MTATLASVTPEQLAQVVLAQRDTAPHLWIHRSDCANRCWLAAAYVIRDQTVVAVRRSKFLMDDGERKVVESRAWLSHDVPQEPLVIGCSHRTWTVTISTEPRVTSSERLIRT